VNNTSYMLPEDAIDLSTCFNQPEFADITLQLLTSSNETEPATLSFCSSLNISRQDCSGGKLKKGGQKEEAKKGGQKGGARRMLRQAMITMQCSKSVWSKESSWQWSWS
jgi:hypothetical protein